MREAFPTKHSNALAALVIIALLLGSSLLVSSAQQQRARSAPFRPGAVYQSIQFAGVSQQWGLANGQNDSVYQSTRTDILAYIYANPGVYLRELSEDTGLAMGVVEYHVWALLKDGKVEDFRSGRFRRFFATAMYGETEQKVISLMRQETPSRILSTLSKEEEVTHVGLAATLGVTSQALTWQMGRMRGMGVIEGSSSPRENARTSYRLTEEVAQLVWRYMHSGLAPAEVRCADRLAAGTEPQVPMASQDSQQPRTPTRMNYFDHFIVDRKARPT
jgi:DNA-binding MarR family transcriptional regulator